MLLTPHILTGVLIITKVQNPILGLFLVLLSHYFLDSFPQKEYSIKNIKSGLWRQTMPEFLRVFLDIALAMLIVFFITDYSLLIFAAVFLAILPDGITLLSCIFPKNKLLILHQKLHSAINAVCENKKIPAYWGVISQIAVITIAIFFLL